MGRISIILVGALGILSITGCSSVPCGKAELVDDTVRLVVQRVGNNVTGDAYVGGDNKGRVSGSLPRNSGSSWCSSTILAGAFRDSVGRLIQEEYPDACADCPQTGKPCSLRVIVKNASCAYVQSGNQCTITCPVGSIVVECRKCDRGYPLCQIDTTDVSDDFMDGDSRETVGYQLNLSDDESTLEACTTSPTQEESFDPFSAILLE